jgi:hypothetical protein
VWSSYVYVWSSYVYECMCGHLICMCGHLMCMCGHLICTCYTDCIGVFTLDVGLLASSQYPKGPALTDTGFSWFSCV